MIIYLGACSGISCMQCYSSKVTFGCLPNTIFYVKKFLCLDICDILQVSPQQNFQATTIHVLIQVYKVKMVLIK